MIERSVTFQNSGKRHALFRYITITARGRKASSYERREEALKGGGGKRAVRGLQLSFPARPERFGNRSPPLNFHAVGI